MKLPVTIELLGASQDELKALSTKLPSAGRLTMKPFKDSLMFWKGDDTPKENGPVVQRDSSSAAAH